MVEFRILVSLLVFAPLFYAGNHPPPLMVLELMALVLAVLLFKNKNAWQQIPKIYWMFVLCIFLLPLIHLIPLPYGVWRVLAGHEAYAVSLTTVDAVHGMRAISMVPAATEYAWLALLPGLMVFLATLSLSRDQVKTAVTVFMVMAAFQALLGLMQYGAGPDSILRFSYHTQRAQGTYVNPDNLAGLLEMALPIGLALLTVSLGRHHTARRHVRSLRQKFALLAETHVNKAVAYGLASILMLLALIFTHSRTGNMLAMVVILLSAVMFAPRLGGRNVFGLIGSFTAIGLMLAIEIGMVPVLNRFIQQDPLQDARWIIFEGTLRAIGEFFPLGSGAGTFAEVYPRFHPGGFDDVFVNYAHNDYLEWIMEGGIVAALMIAVFFVLYFARWTKVWQRGEWRLLNFIQVGAGIGIFAMMLHTFVDFNLHIPANQIYFAFLAGLFFYQLTPAYEAAEREVEQDAPSAAPIAVAAQEKKSFIVQSANPFSE